MLIQRRIPWQMVASIGLRAILVAAAWGTVVVTLYTLTGLALLKLPFLAVATVGTAVAFYVGFKNNASYERFWEGRKIRGGVVNVSRSWAVGVLAYVEPGQASAAAVSARRQLVYRQLAWINALRLQLRKESRFLKPDAHYTTKARLAKDADHMRNDWSKELPAFLSPAEFAAVTPLINPATHLLNNHPQELAQLLGERRLDLFHQLDLMRLVGEMFTLQGQAERIKNTPFPRQYAEFSRWFVRAFNFLVPFGLLDVFSDQIDAAQTPLQLVLAVIPMLFSSGIIFWVFASMEGIGDASEDPFERSMNDVPMNALCRTIERDLRQLLGETEVPEPEAAAGMVLY